MIETLETMEEIIPLKNQVTPLLAQASHSYLERATAWMKTAPKLVMALLVLALTVLIGWVDFASGWELSLFVLYAVPIILAVWFLGAQAGIAVAAICGVVWLFANATFNPYETKIGYSWAALSRFFYFAVVVLAVSGVRKRQAEDSARIRLLEEQRQLEMDIVKASEHEKQRIGQDLHDGLCQHLAAIGCASRVLADDLREKNDPEAKVAAMIENSIQEAVIEARNLSRGILPVHLDRSGLAAAISGLASSMSRLYNIDIDVIECDDLPFNVPEVSMHLYRIAQESLANAIRHSGASNITISLRYKDGFLDLSVNDNGSWLDTSSSKGDGMGLRTMRYRARALGTTLEIGKRESGGTYVRCRLKHTQQAL